MDNTASNSDGHDNPQNDSTSSDQAKITSNNNQSLEKSSEGNEVRNSSRVPGGNSLESEEATSSSEAVTSASSTEVESLAASLIRAQEEHRRAQAEKIDSEAQEEKVEVK